MFGCIALPSLKSALQHSIWSTFVIPQIALFLVDTQGFFDHRASAQDANTLGILSFLLSSLQCFNVRQQIQDSVMKHVYVSYFTK